MHADTGLGKFWENRRYQNSKLVTTRIAHVILMTSFGCQFHVVQKSYFAFVWVYIITMGYFDSFSKWTKFTICFLAKF